MAIKLRPKKKHDWEIVDDFFYDDDGDYQAFTSEEAESELGWSHNRFEDAVREHRLQTWNRHSDVLVCGWIRRAPGKPRELCYFLTGDKDEAMQWALWHRRQMRSMDSMITPIENWISFQTKREKAKSG